MSAIVHRRYALASLVFAACFAAAFALKRPAAGIAALAVYAVVATFYGASFLRGAEEAND